MADTTNPRIYVEPPIPTTTEFCTVDQVRAVVHQHMTGRFRMSALLVERMNWNPRFRAAINTRLSGLLSAEVRFEPIRENRDARRAAREFSEDWPAMATSPVRRQYRKWSILMGFALGQRALELSPTSGRQIFKIRPYWPGFANWYWAENGYRIQTHDGGVVDAKSPGLKDITAPSPALSGLVNPSEQPWVIDEPNGANSWREAMFLAAWRPWLGHELATRDQNRNSEKNGVGAYKLMYPPGEGDQHEQAIERFLDLADNIGSEGAFPLQQGENGRPGYDVVPFEFNGVGNAAISDALNAAAVALAILFLGHNLTTEIKGGGSYAAAGVGEYIRDDIKHDDAANEWAVFGPQLARPYCLLNYSDPDLAPRARYITDSTAQNRAVAQMQLAIAQAIQYLRLNVPSFDVDAYCEQWRIPLLPNGAVQVPAAMPTTTTPAPPAAPTQQPPKPTDDEDEDE